MVIGFCLCPFLLNLQSYKSWEDIVSTTRVFFRCCGIKMSAMASQITGVLIVCSTNCSSASQWEHRSASSLAFERGIHLWPVDCLHKGLVIRKMFPYDDVIMLQIHARPSLRTVSQHSGASSMITATPLHGWRPNNSVLLKVATWSRWSRNGKWTTFCNGMKRVGLLNSLKTEVWFRCLRLSFVQIIIRVHTH